MTAVVVPMVAFTCDGDDCKERIPNPDNEYIAWADLDSADADASEQDWLTLPDGRHYCAMCRYARHCDACEEHSDALTFSAEHGAKFCPPCFARETAAPEGMVSNYAADNALVLVDDPDVIRRHKAMSEEGTA